MWLDFFNVNLNLPFSYYVTFCESMLNVCMGNDIETWGFMNSELDVSYVILNLRKVYAKKTEINLLIGNNEENWHKFSNSITICCH